MTWTPAYMNPMEEEAVMTYASGCHLTFSLDILVCKPRVSTNTLGIILKTHHL